MNDVGGMTKDARLEMYRQQVNDLQAKLAAAQARVRWLLNEAARMVGCQECWKGSSCGTDCHMHQWLAAEPPQEG